MKFQVSSNVREIELSLQTAGNDELARPPLPTLPSPSLPVMSLRPCGEKGCACFERTVPGRTLINQLFLNGLQ